MPNRSILTNCPAPMSLSHVVLRTAHLDETITFYETLVGMKVNFRNEAGAALSHDGEHHRIALAAVPAAEQNSFAPGLEHLAFKLRSMGDLLGNYERLKQLGVLPSVTIHHGGTISAYYVDPDGVQVETFVDTKTAELSLEEMDGEGFRANPVGVPIDFDELARRFIAGEPLTSLFAQPALQEGQIEELMGKMLAARVVAGSLS
jgi:catechol 2,3-dioxygenase-like lactoylglutathione lyase family enzyme